MKKSIEYRERIVNFCGGKKCCPQLKIITDDAGTNSTITDDFGGSVKLTGKELSQLKKRLSKMEDI